MLNAWLPRALDMSRARGFLGPGDIQPHIDHARGFIGAWNEFRTSPPRRVLDLGSGGGLPGFVLLDHWGVQETEVTLLDSMIRRTSFLLEVLDWPDAPAGGRVLTGRAEDLAREGSLEGSFDLVTARSFGPPAVTAECAVRFLTTGGLLIVSEPPDSDGRRWKSEGLALLALEAIGVHRESGTFQVLQRTGELDDRFPRASGVPSKRPLF